MLLADPNRSQSFVSWVIHRRRLVLLISTALAIVAAWQTVRTYASLKSDLEELLPKTAPAVAAIDVVRERVAGLRYLGVVVDTGGPHNLPAAERFVQDLARRVRSYPPGLVAAVRADVREERRFVEKYALQLLSPDEVREVRRAVEQRRDRQVLRGLDIDLLESDEADTSDEPNPAAKLREKYEKRIEKLRYPGDRFVSADGQTRVLLLQADSHATDYETDRALIDRVKADVTALGFPESYATSMRVGYAGDVATRVEEMAGLATDLGLSGAMVVLLVVAVIVLFFRSWRALPMLGVPLLFGTVYAFAIVALPPLSIRHLNSNTAFLASIIVGNGVNSGIILLARFFEERKLGNSLEVAIETAVRQTYIATLAASLAAAAAYGSLVFTDFRGFNQFGWIGGIGMLTCWGATYLIGPPLMYWLGGPMSRSSRARGPGIIERSVTQCLAYPRAVIAVSALALLVSLVGIARRSGDYVEYDLSTLRRRDSWDSGERYWGKRMDATLKRYLTPTLIMADDAEQARTIEARLRELSQQERAGGLIGSVQSSASLLPKARAQAVEEGKRLAALITPRMKAELSPSDRGLVERALSPEALHPLEPSELPDVLAVGLRERNGRMDRNVLVYPALGARTWDVQAIRGFAADLRQASTIDGRPKPVSGSLLLSSDIAAAMLADGPRATVLAFFAVLGICAIAFRSLRLSMAAIASLFAGVVLMLGGLAFTGARFNFSNFVALPITFGIAADYSINVLKRFQAEGSLSVEHALARTGGAVVLCSATTIIGYGSLLIAQNRALFSFGVMAVCGEIACLATAVLVLPAALRLRKSSAKTQGVCA